MTVATQKRTSSIADMLLEEGLIDDDQHAEALKEYSRSKRSLVRILADMELITEEIRLALLKKTSGAEMVDLTDFVPSAEVSSYVSKEHCRRARAVPLQFHQGALALAMEDPLDMRTISDFEKIYGKSIKPMLAKSEDILTTIERLPNSSESINIGSLGESEGSKIAETLSLATLVFFPLLAFVYFISVSSIGKEWFGSFGLAKFEIGLVFVLVFGSWAAIAYFVNDLLFNKSSDGI